MVNELDEIWDKIPLKVKVGVFLFITFSIFLIFTPDFNSDSVTADQKAKIELQKQQQAQKLEEQNADGLQYDSSVLFYLLVIIIPMMMGVAFVTIFSIARRGLR